ncbi:MAG: hypothetical protein VB130_13540 [Clostridium sp.]|nr:hypothetical protein [Clostridium sp.]
MNKEFVKKIIKSEKYKFEAIKEILPKEIRKKVEDLEKETLNLFKEVAFEIIEEDIKEKTSSKATKKIDVDFS